MRATVHIRTVPNTCAALGWTNGRSVTIDRTAGGAGLPIGFNGIELVCLAVGASLTDGVFLEARRRGIHIASIHVDVSADDAGPGGWQFTASVRLESDADEATIAEIVERADKAAAIPNLLRLGTSVRLTDASLIGAGSRKS